MTYEKIWDYLGDITDLNKYFKDDNKESDLEGVNIMGNGDWVKVMFIHPTYHYSKSIEELITS